MADDEDPGESDSERSRRIAVITVVIAVGSVLAVVLFGIVFIIGACALN